MAVFLVCLIIQNYTNPRSRQDEVRVGSEWGLIANKTINFTPTVHFHPEYVKTSGNQTITGIKTN